MKHARKALALLLAYNCSRLAERANEEIEHDLYVACQLTGDFSRTDSIAQLIEAGADPKAKDKAGQTPLHLATSPQAIRLLTAAGAAVIILICLTVIPPHESTRICVNSCPCTIVVN